MSSISKTLRTIYEGNMLPFFTGCFEPAIRLVLTPAPPDSNLFRVHCQRYKSTSSLHQRVNARARNRHWLNTNSFLPTKPSRYGNRLQLHCLNSAFLFSDSIHVTMLLIQCVDRAAFSFLRRQRIGLDGIRQYLAAAEVAHDLRHHTSRRILHNPDECARRRSCQLLPR